MTPDSLVNIGVSVMAFVLTLVNGWLVLVLRGLQAQLDTLRVEHGKLREKQSDHETRMAERTLTRDEFKNEMSLQTTQLVTLMNAAIRNVKLPNGR